MTLRRHNHSSNLSRGPTALLGRTVHPQAEARLHSSSVVEVTNCPRLSGLNNTNLCYYSSVGQKPSRSLTVLRPRFSATFLFGGSGGESVSVPSASGGCPHSGARDHILPASKPRKVECILLTLHRSDLIFYLLPLFFKDLYLFVRGRESTSRGRHRQREKQASC